MKGAIAVDAAAHRLKLGFEGQVNRLDVQNDEKPGQVARLEDALYRSSIFIQDFRVSNRVLSLYVQDGWTVTDRLHVNVGLRWDGQWLLDQNGDVGQSLLDQFQPRLGIVYQPGAPGGSKIFVHAGRHYQQLALLWSTIGLAGFDQHAPLFRCQIRSFLLNLCFV